MLKNYQAKLFPYAYNITGSVDDARDAVQDVILKYTQMDGFNPENEMGYLVKGVINQAINIKNRNSKSVGSRMWLPEPVATDYADADIKRTDIISYSMLVLLERLNPKERAVFILKEAFNYSHEDIAEVLDMTVDNSRKILSRSKSGLKGIRENYEPQQKASSFLEKYIDTIKNGNVKELEKLLSEDIAVMADGGGRISVVAELTNGVQAAMDLVLYVYKTYQTKFTIQYISVNNQPALLFFNEGELINCQVFDIDPDTNKITNIFSVVDPEKLKNIAKN